MISAFSAHEGEAVLQDLQQQFGEAEPLAIVFFCPHTHDGAALSAALRERYPQAEVLGCTTAGAFSEAEEHEQGVSAMALEATEVHRCHGALAPFGAGVAAGIKEATEGIAASLGLDLRTAATDRYVGLALIDGLHFAEEEANHALGMAAPGVAFLGGSAGDGLRLEATAVFYNGTATDHGAALLLLETAAPFTIMKTQSVEATDYAFTVTRANADLRRVYEVGGRPILEVYAEVSGIPEEDLGFDVFRQYPLALMDADQPWLRSPMRVAEDGGLQFLCQLAEGTPVQLMRQTNLIPTTMDALAMARQRLLQPMRGGLVFNCVYRRLELDAAGLRDAHRALYQHLTIAGFHTYGESYLGHMNQTCVALLWA